MAAEFRDVESYSKAVRASVELAQRDLLNVMRVAVAQATSAMDIEHALYAAMQAITLKYGRMAGAAAVEYYLKMQEGSGSRYIPTIAADDIAAIEASISWAMAAMSTGDMAEAASRLMQSVDTHVKGHATRTMTENGIKDPADVHFARVPVGATTCDFCITLASRGFVYASRETAGELSKYHPNCDCMVIAEYGKELKGYDGVLYQHAYEAMAGQREPDERVQSFLSKNRNARNARRRLLYKQKREEAGKPYTPQDR